MTEDTNAEVEETIARLRRLHEGMRDLPPLDAEFIEWAKNEGRDRREAIIPAGLKTPKG